MIFQFCKHSTSTWQQTPDDRQRCTLHSSAAAYIWCMTKRLTTFNRDQQITCIDYCWFVFSHAVICHIYILVKKQHMGGSIGTIAPRRLLAKNRDARPIKSIFNQSQNALKLAFWAQKSKTFLGREHIPSPDTSPVGMGTPPRRLQHLDPRAYGARLDALDLGASIRPTSHTRIRPRPAILTAIYQTNMG